MVEARDLAVYAPALDTCGKLVGCGLTDLSVPVPLFLLPIILSLIAYPRVPPSATHAHPAPCYLCLTPQLPTSRVASKTEEGAASVSMPLVTFRAASPTPPPPSRRDSYAQPLRSKRPWPQRQQLAVQGEAVPLRGAAGALAPLRAPS